MTRLCLFLLLATSLSLAAEPIRLSLQVDGVEREALIAVPETAKTQPAPVIFAFHGHGGTMEKVMRGHGFQRLWPEALVVCPQGLNTPGQLTDPKGLKAGWQHGPGDQGDRDLKFFDALLGHLRSSYRVDEHRLYATGHSNGGGFTYLLWSQRADLFAAFAPSAAASRQVVGALKPKSAMHIAGENDPLVKFAWQKATIEVVKKHNHCGEGRAWELDERCTYFPSETKTPLVTAIHGGTHNFPDEAPGLIVKFFKSQMKP